MTEAVFIVRGAPPYTLWYKLYASGNEDPDIYGNWLKEQLIKYCSVDEAEIVQQIDCNNSREVVRLYEEHVDATIIVGRPEGRRNWKFDQMCVRWRQTRWVQIKIGDIRDFIKTVV
jgi:hypothetical protein